MCKWKSRYWQVMRVRRKWLRKTKQNKKKHLNGRLTRTRIPWRKWTHITLANSPEITKPKINFAHFFGEKIRLLEQRIKCAFYILLITINILKCFIYIYAYVCACISASMQVLMEARKLGHMELELWMLVNNLMVVLGNELGSSTRELHKCS